MPLPEYTATVVEIPERLAKLVKKEPPRPSPAPKPVPKEPEEKPQKVKDESKPEPEKKKPDKELRKKAPAPEPPQVAKKAAENLQRPEKKPNASGFWPSKIRLRILWTKRLLPNSVLKPV